MYIPGKFTIKVVVLLLVEIWEDTCIWTEHIWVALHLGIFPRASSIPFFSNSFIMHAAKSQHKIKCSVDVNLPLVATADYHFTTLAIKTGLHFFSHSYTIQHASYLKNIIKSMGKSMRYYLIDCNSQIYRWICVGEPCSKFGGLLQLVLGSKYWTHREVAKSWTALASAQQQKWGKYFP